VRVHIVNEVQPRRGGGVVRHGDQARQYRHSETRTAGAPIGGSAVGNAACHFREKKKQTGAVADVPWRGGGAWSEKESATKSAGCARAGRREIYRFRMSARPRVVNRLVRSMPNC